MLAAVVTVDQRASRTTPDRVPAALDRLARRYPELRLERTVGDEFQGVVADATQLAEIVHWLLRTAEWNVGLGLGPVEEPLPRDPRAGRGSAYVHARTAVTAAKSAPWHVRVEGDDREAARALESLLWLWAAVLERRSTKGWEVVDLLDTGLTHEATAAKLGISQSAVTQRARAAGLTEGRRAQELAVHLAAAALRGAA